MLNHRRVVEPWSAGPNVVPSPGQHQPLLCFCLGVFVYDDAQIADYPFTTVTPNLGVWEEDNERSKGLVLADIPGLLEGTELGWTQQGC